METTHNGQNEIYYCQYWLHGQGISAPGVWRFLRDDVFINCNLPVKVAVW